MRERHGRAGGDGGADVEPGTERGANDRDDRAYDGDSGADDGDSCADWIGDGGSYD